MSQYSLLNKFTDPGHRQVVKILMDRIATLEAAVPNIGTVSTALTAHLDSGGNQLKSLADPTAPQDAVTLLYMQKWVEGRLATVQAQVAATADAVAAIPLPTDPPPPAPTVPVGTDDPSIPAAGPLGTDAIPFGTLTFINSPDPSAWASTAAISQLTISAAGFAPVFSKQSGPPAPPATVGAPGTSWPDVTPPGWSGPIQFTLWGVFHVAGIWYATGVIQFWRGLVASGGPPSQLHTNWFYGGAWAPLSNYQPAVGEQVGFFVTAGNARQGANDYVIHARSNVVVVSYPADSGAVFSFA